MIYYLLPGTQHETSFSGGYRKLLDHLRILQDYDFATLPLYQPQVVHTAFHPDDIVVVPEVWGDAIQHVVPSKVRRISFVQNGYLAGVETENPLLHWLVTTRNLETIFSISDFTTDQVRTLPVHAPVIRLHSSCNEDGRFSYGAWPREKVVCYFSYKVDAATEAALFDGLDLPPGWAVERISGWSDSEIAYALRTAAILAAPIRNEGFCAMTAEAVISGAVVVGWPGGPADQDTFGGPMEYLPWGCRAYQDDVADLRALLVAKARDIDVSGPIDHDTKSRSDWFQSTYSRQREIAELVAVFRSLT